MRKKALSISTWMLSNKFYTNEIILKSSPLSTLLCPISAKISSHSPSFGQNKKLRLLGGPLAKPGPKK